MKEIQQLEVLQYCITQKIPFAISRLPNSNQSKLIISKSAQELSLKKALESDGFVLAPFMMNKQKLVFLNKDWEITRSISDTVFESIKEIHPQEEVVDLENYEADSESYRTQFSKLLQTIESGKLSKAILSRVKPNSDIQKEQAHHLYYALEEAYGNAYVFMFYSPQSGLWAGASPELLLEVSGQQATTVSLAGTRVSEKKSSNWGEKEIVEQQIVTDYVGDLLKAYKVDDFIKDGPNTISAGKMVHLKTTYKFNPKYLEGKLPNFIDALHPTPAVCGLPKHKAMDAILSIEKHFRGYYAGFLGRVKPNSIHLFVNIRSLQFVSSGVNLYLGGGITKDSDVNREWDETELKAQTMLSVIKSICENK